MDPAPAASSHFVGGRRTACHNRRNDTHARPACCGRRAGRRHRGGSLRGTYRGHIRQADGVQVRRLHAAQRAAGHPARGSLDADRPRDALVPRRIEGREDRAHRLRAPVRAHDVQGQQERAARGAHLVHRVGRWAEQRLHHRGHDGLLADRAGAVPAADAVARGGPDGVAAHRGRHVQDRAAGGQGGTPAAGGEPAVRPPLRDHLRHTRSRRTPTSTPSSAAWPTSRPRASRTCASSTAPTTVPTTRRW